MLPLSEFPHTATDTIRYGDTDRQGHVNNAVFSSFLETGRVVILYNEEHPLTPPGASFVIVSLHLDFLKEITWPGKIDIGTGVKKTGGSSIVFYQQLFQNGVCVAKAETVIVQVKDGKSFPLTEEARAELARWGIA